MNITQSRWSWSSFGAKLYIGSIVSDVTKALVLVCPSPSIHSVLLRICLVIEWRLTFYFVHPSVPFFLNYIGNLPSVCLSVTNQYIPATFLFVILTMNNVLYLKLTLNVTLKQTCLRKSELTFIFFSLNNSIHDWDCAYLLSWLEAGSC